MNMQQYRKTEQRGQVVQSGRFWSLRYWQRCNENGVIVRKRMRVRLGEVANSRSRKPPQEIQDAAKAIMRGVNASTVAPSMVVTVGDFTEQVYLKWTDSYKRPSTAFSYRETWERHLKRYCADAWLTDVQTRDVQSWLDALAGNPQHPLSVSTLQHAKFFLSGLFVHAAQQGYRSSEKGNPVTMTRIPAQAVRARTTHAYTAEEVSLLLAALAEKPVAATAVAIAAFAGLRIGEVGALRWEDFHDGCLYVSRSVWRGKISEPKTEASAAPVAVVPQLAEILSMHHARAGFPTSGPMFRTTLGTSLGMGNILCRDILPVCNRCLVCGLPKGVQHEPKEEHAWQRDPSAPVWRGWHAFRRGLCTNLQREGAAAATAQAALRHANLSTTIGHYTKSVRADVNQALEKYATQIKVPLIGPLEDHSGTAGIPPKMIN